ncbi:MAG: HAD hydrolase-like protein [Pseudomonadota bacterium]|nr:HAD hydrolase-like protein [Pseudomonadota bacterium]
MRLLVTDLDNTLYDWVTAFARSIRPMVTELAALLRIDEDTVYAELKSVHRRHHNSEHPFAVLELDSVARAFPAATPVELLTLLERPLAAFNAARATWLRLYEGVSDTLGALRARGVVIVGHTEAIGPTARQRLRLLGIEHHFAGVYCLANALGPHPSPGWQDKGGVPLHVVPREERKPNPALLRDICASELARPEEAVYVGDSLTRDIWMARRAGVCAVWARYGRGYTDEDWATVVRVSHWTPEDVRREARLRVSATGVSPDHAIAGFGELLGIVPTAAARPVRRRVRKVG